MRTTEDYAQSARSPSTDAGRYGRVRWGVPTVAVDTERHEGFVLPVGTVTLLLADLEGSSRLWEADPDRMTLALSRYDALVAEAVGRHEGVRPEEQGEGDSFVAAFARASDALACALDVQTALAKDEGIPFTVRIAVHTGEVQLRTEGSYIGTSVNRAARIRELAHGGQTLLSQVTAELVADRLPDGCTLVDLGSHRLRDLARPEHVFELRYSELAQEFPPLRSLDEFPNNLPLQLTTFIGREREGNEIRDLLSSERLVTLTGSGGVGKTRLALQVAADLAGDFPDGVWWAELGAVIDAALVPAAIAQALRAKEVAGQPLLDTVRKDFRRRRALVLLDNCEQVVGACADAADVLVRGCPDVTVLATSREPLGTQGEATYSVPPLSLPDEHEVCPVEALTTFEAVRLFVDRALRARPNFTVTNETAPHVAQICQRLDGIPLAIELAAARTRMMSPEQILDGLADRFHLLTGGGRTAVPRQQTLRASVDWSHELLSEAERTLLRRLAAFVGGFTLDAAESVCSGDGIDRYAVLDLLTQLVDKSLVGVMESETGTRYRLLETIRQYAAERLEETGGTSSLRDRHRDYYVEFAVGAEPGPGETDWEGAASTMAAEYENVRAALAWSTQNDDPEPLVTLAGALWWFWSWQGAISEGRRTLESALERSASLAPTLRGRVLLGLGQLAWVAGDVMAIPPYANEALTIFRGAGENRGTAYALQSLGWVATFIDPPTARSHLEESLSLARDVGDRALLWSDLFWLGYGSVLNDEFAEGRSFLEEALSLAEKTGWDEAAVQSRTWLGFGAWQQGELRKARELLEDAGRAQTGERATALQLLSGVLVRLGEYTEARACAEEAHALACEFPERILWGEPLMLWTLAQVELAEGNTVPARGRMEEAVGLLGPMTPSRIRGLMLLTLAVAELGVGAMGAARGHVNDALGLLSDGPRSSSAWARLTEAILDRADGDHERAETHGHQALALSREVGIRPTFVDSLELLARLAAEQESFREAARLYGAAAAMREEMGYVRWSADGDEYDAGVAVVREGLGEAFDAAWAEGAALSMHEAIAYAQRGRGERKRPSAGWASLTPMELDVTKLVAQGLSNPQIAERLFISRSTVKYHLSQIFSKLGLSARTELAAEASRRGITSS